MVGMDTAIRFIGLWEDLEIQAWDTAGSEVTADSGMAVLGALAAIDVAHAAATIRVVARAVGAIVTTITIVTIDRPPIETVLRSGSTESLRVIWTERRSLTIFIRSIGIMIAATVSKRSRWRPTEGQ
jgi:hypothetical protein